MPTTGPKSQRGKAVSSRNAWKHGILSFAIVINEAEDPADWEAHLDGMFESLKPEGHLESMLTERIAISLWKMRRVDYFQGFVTHTHMNEARRDFQTAEAFSQGTLGKGIYPEVSDDDVRPLRARRILPRTDDLVKIMRYESHLQRQYIQTLHELEAMQTRGGGGASPLARLDITGALGG
jgi:hypothetical protein